MPFSGSAASSLLIPRPPAPNGSGSAESRPQSASIASPGQPRLQPPPRACMPVESPAIRARPELASARRLLIRWFVVSGRVHSLAGFSVSRVLAPARDWRPHPLRMVQLGPPGPSVSDPSGESSSGPEPRNLTRLFYFACIISMHCCVLQHLIELLAMPAQAPVSGKLAESWNLPSHRNEPD